MAVTVKFVSEDTIKLFQTKTTNEVICHLLWGDSLQLQETLPATGRVKVKARGRTGFVNTDSISDEALLEYYFIDVGQGDGILIVTPDRKHIMIDGEYIRRKLVTKRNAADFIDWKFARDYGKTKITIDAMMASHNDEDHYGGLWDMINPNETNELQLTKVEVKNFYYAGINWFVKGGKRSLGPNTNGFYTPLLDNKTALKKHLPGGSGAVASGFTLQGQWQDFISLVVDNIPVVERLSNKKNSNGFVPGFEPKPGKPSIKVLAPIEELEGGKPALKKFSSNDAITTNGHSLLLRVDYGKTRVLLTGDLNSKSQRHILNFYQNNIQELACDIAKACHHGADDCSLEFLSHLSAGATIISSGDNEGHNHPRPKIVAASAITGHKTIRDDRIVTPLIYSTEIARSYKITEPDTLITGEPGSEQTFKPTNKKASIQFTSSGQVRTRDLWKSMFVSGIVYGLVNVRTNGEKILCATMSETSGEWEIETFLSRFVV